MARWAEGPVQAKGVERGLGAQGSSGEGRGDGWVVIGVRVGPVADP